MQSVNRRFLCYCLIVVSLLIAGCWSASRFEPPIAKTNQNPTQRYEITVELVDPPADVKNISGVAYFSIPDVICMPTPDRIAGYTPGSRYKKRFSLVPTGQNTYQGHIFRDWPIDEDYFGLGVCKWELAYVDTTVARSNEFLQITRLSSAELLSLSDITAYCREEMRDKFDMTCFTPSGPDRAEELNLTSYLVKVKPSRTN